MMDDLHGDKRPSLYGAIVVDHGRVVENVDIRGLLVFRGAGGTVRNCRIYPPANPAELWRYRSRPPRS